MNNTKFALVLRKCRENSGLTQKQVADALGVERSTYSYYETGITRPTGVMIIKLSNIFNIKYKILMDAVSDIEFDESREPESNTAISDIAWRERERMITIGKDEQNLLLKYRTLTTEQKGKLFDTLDEMRMENFEKERKAKK